MLIRLLKGLIYNSVAELRIMKIYRVLGVILVALCFFACNSNKENEYEYQPLTIDNYAEVSFIRNCRLSQITFSLGRLLG